MYQGDEALGVKGIRHERFPDYLIGFSWDGALLGQIRFIFAPWSKHRVKAFKQITTILAYLKIRVARGVAGLMNVYVPHNLKPFPEQMEFYVDLMLLGGHVQLIKGSTSLAT